MLQVLHLICRQLPQKWVQSEGVEDTHFVRSASWSAASFDD
jgi:hypothetical protein